MAASISKPERSTTSSTRVSMPTRSPFCTSRAETWPVSGERSVVSASDLRAMSSAASAAWWVASALARLAVAVSSAVLEMKPWRTSAWLLSKVRLAMATCAWADSACRAVWRTRAWASVLSMRATTSPAFTGSPSRLVRPWISPAVFALMAAVSSASTEPDRATVWVRSMACTVTTSVGASV